MTARTVLLVTEHNGWKLLVAPAALDLGHSLATCTWRGLERALSDRPAGYAAVVAVPENERDAFRLLSELHRRRRSDPVVLVSPDPAVRAKLADLGSAVAVVPPGDISAALSEQAPPLANAC